MTDCAEKKLGDFERITIGWAGIGRYNNSGTDARETFKGVFIMIQFIGVAIAVLGLTFSILKDYQSGAIKIPNIAQITQPTEVAQKPQVIYPLQHCQMVYDPNIDKVFYQRRNSWPFTWLGGGIRRVY
jgi:hypothetical protein